MKRKILLLEDDLQLNQTIKRFLEINNFEVYSIFDAYEANDIIYEKSIDLMLLDVKVPKQNGFELLKELREANINTPAIFISSLNSIDDIEKGFGVGADDYLKKPFELRELLIRINAKIKQNYKSYQDEIDLGNGYSFNSKDLILTKDSKTVPLKRKELKLLSLFLQNRGKLLNYEEINSTLWDFDEEPSSGSLRTYIKTLRSILGKDKIETIKNVGYRFVSQ